MTDVFRKEYTPLTTEQKEYAAQVKMKAQELHDLLTDASLVAISDGRCLAIAKTELETAVMWAVKGITI